MSAFTDERAEEIVAALNQFARDGIPRDHAEGWSRMQPEVATTRGFLPPSEPEIELKDGTIITWSRDIRRWEVALPDDPAADDVVLVDLIALRRTGLPAWRYINLDVSTHAVTLRVPTPADLDVWREAMGSTATVVAEAMPTIMFHHIHVFDWRPGWTVYMTAVVELYPEAAANVASQIPVAVHTTADGAWGEWP